MKKQIPDELLPLRFRGKGYFISDDCHVYGLLGHQLKENTSCEYGFFYPKVLGRNLYWLYASVFIDNPNKYSKVFYDEDTKEIKWVSDEEYFNKLEAFQGFPPRKKPLTEVQKEYIREHHANMEKQLIADILKVSRMTVYRYIKEFNGQ